MKTSLKLYGQFFKTTITQPSTLIVLFAGLLLNAVFIVVVPICLNYSKVSEQIASWEIRTMSQLVSICTVSLFCSVLGEIIANPNDRIFILSRPVKRSIYLTAKLMLSFTFAITFAVIISICYYILHRWCISKSINLYSGKMKFEYMMIISFIMCIFGAATGTSLRYYAREMIVSVIVLVIMMAYGISFSFLITQNQANSSDFEYYETFLVPLTGLLPATIGVIGVGYFLNNRINIGV